MHMRELCPPLYLYQKRPFGLQWAEKNLDEVCARAVAMCCPIVRAAVYRVGLWLVVHSRNTQDQQHGQRLIDQAHSWPVHASVLSNWVIRNLQSGNQ